VLKKSGGRYAVRLKTCTRKRCTRSPVATSAIAIAHSLVSDGNRSPGSAYLPAVREKDARAALLPRARLPSLTPSAIRERAAKNNNFSIESFVHRFTAVLAVAADSDPCADRTPARKQVAFQAHSPSDLPSHVIFGVAFRNEQSQYIAITQKTENHKQKNDSTAGAAQGNFEATSEQKSFKYLQLQCFRDTSKDRQRSSA